MSSMSSLYLGVTGLNVSQAALNVTSHNLANVDTTGFVRQQAVQTDFNYRKLGETYFNTLQQGLGANFAEVKQVRDSFLDAAFRKETGRQAFYEAQYDAVSEVETLFGELEGETFQDVIGEFWTSLQELAKEPDSVVTRASLIETAVSFIERADNISQQLKAYQVNLNTKIQDQVDRINEIGDNIKTLNIKIRQYESTGIENANDLRDERNNLLDELSEYVGITYKENTDGVVTVNVEGVPFVTEDLVFDMGTVPVSEGSTMLKPVWSKHGNVDVYSMDRAFSTENNTDIGSLRGLLTARGTKAANYSDIPLRDNYESDALYNQAVLDYNNTINNSVIMTVQAQFDQLIHGITTTINNVLCPNKEVTLPDGSTLTILDDANAPIGMDDNKTMGEALFNRKSMDRYGDYEYIDIVNEEGNNETIYARIYNEENAENNYSLYTLGEIEVNPEILKNYSIIPLSSNTGSGDYDISTASNLLSTWQEAFATLSPNTLTKNNFDDYYTSFISELANRGEQMNTISLNQTSMVESISNQRLEVTGVSSDEELTNLIKFQHAYNASARYITTVSDMLEHIIERLGNG